MTTSRKVPALSVFFPFWNEEKNIEKVINSAIPVLSKVAEKWEIIMVDDGSSDDTAKIAKKLIKKNDRLKLIVHSPNRGYGAALRSGLSNARFDLVVFTDGDGQFDFSEISKFLHKIEGADMVIGYREKRKDHPFRHLLMMLLKIWDAFLFGFYFRDIDCGFKMFRKSALEKIMPLNSEGAMITTEILAKAKREKLKIEEVKVAHYPRIFGDQSGGNFRVIWRAIKESMYLWKELKFNYGRS